MTDLLKPFSILNVCLAIATQGCGGAVTNLGSDDAAAESGHKESHDAGSGAKFDAAMPQEASADAPDELGLPDVTPVEAGDPDVVAETSPPPGEDCDSCLVVCSVVVSECGTDCETVIACILAGGTAQDCVCEYPAGGPAYINYTSCFEPQECPGGTGECDPLCVGTGDFLGCTPTGSVPIPSMAMCSGG
jgi:hypothetical protein